MDPVALPVPGEKRLPQTGTGSYHRECPTRNRVALMEGMEIPGDEVRDCMGNGCQIVQQTDRREIQGLGQLGLVDRPGQVGQLGFARYDWSRNLEAGSVHRELDLSQERLYEG
jgi:hypothetical protein